MGSNGNQFTWGEAALILGVTLVGWDWFVPIGAATLLARQLLAGRLWQKALFNAAAFCVGNFLSRLAFCAVMGRWGDPSSHINWRSALAWAAAAAAFSLWVSAGVSLAISFAQGRRFREMFTRGARVKLVTFLGNSAAGLALVAIGGGNRSTVGHPAVLLPAALPRLQQLPACPARRSDVATAARGDAEPQAHRLPRRARGRQPVAQNLFGSELTEVIIDGDGWCRRTRCPTCSPSGCRPGITDADVKSASPEVAAELTALGLHTVTLAPLESVGKRLGVLLIGFRGPIKIRRRERTVFATFADQTSISLQHARLFEELSAERGRLDAIVQHASDGILLIDGTGAVCSWNPALTLMTGRPNDSRWACPSATRSAHRSRTGCPSTAPSSSPTSTTPSSCAYRSC